MKYKNSILSQDELRQKIDGFSMEHTEEEESKDSFKIVDQSIYKTHSADLEDITDHTKNSGSKR